MAIALWIAKSSARAFLIVAEDGGRAALPGISKVGDISNAVN